MGRVENLKTDIPRFNLICPECEADYDVGNDNIRYVIKTRRIYITCNCCGHSQLLEPR